MALGARVAVAGGAGTRGLAAEEFFDGYYMTRLAAGEMITEVTFPASVGRVSAFAEVRTAAR